MYHPFRDAPNERVCLHEIINQSHGLGLNWVAKIEPKCVCMYVYTYVCLFVLLSAHLSICLYIHPFVCVCVRSANTHTHAHTHTRTHTHTHTQIREDVLARVSGAHGRAPLALKILSGPVGQ